MTVHPFQRKKPRLAVWKFASCDGCQLSVLDCEDELLAIGDRVEIAYFKEATRFEAEGPYDVSLVDGSISTPEDIEQIKKIRDQSKYLVSLGACAIAGGIQALRNYTDVKQYISAVYEHPEYIHTNTTSLPISAYVPVDFDLHGCPVNRLQVIEILTAFLKGRGANIASHSVCMECKRRGVACVMVAHGTACMGPVTHAGCGAICPAYDRGCYGCFGPMETPNTESLSKWFKGLGVRPLDLVRNYRTFNCWAKHFKEESLQIEAQPDRETPYGAASGK